MVLFGVMLVVMSAVCATVMQCRMNPRTPLPWVFGRPAPRTTWQTNALFGLAGGAAVLGGIQLFGTLGYGAIIIMIGSWTGAFALQYKHNHDTAHLQDRRGTGQSMP